MAHRQRLRGGRPRRLALVAAMMVSVTAPAAAQPPDVDRQLRQDARGIDESASHADTARVARRIAEHFSTTPVKISASDPEPRALTPQDVQNLNSKGLGYGDIAIVLALYRRQPGRTFQTIDQLVAMKHAGRGWGRIAKTVGSERIAAVRRDVRQTEQAVRPVARPLSESEHKEAAQIHAAAQKLDAESATAGATPEGQRRVAQAIATALKVTEASVTTLRGQGLGFGELSITLPLADDLKRREGLSEPQAMAWIVKRRADGESWGQVAHDLGLKLGRALGDVQKAQREVAGIGSAKATRTDPRGRSTARPGR